MRAKKELAELSTAQQEGIKQIDWRIADARREMVVLKAKRANLLRCYARLRELASALRANPFDKSRCYVASRRASKAYLAVHPEGEGKP